MTPLLEAKADQKRLEALLAEDKKAIEAARKQRTRQRAQARRAGLALQEAKLALRSAARRR